MSNRVACRLPPVDMVSFIALAGESKQQAPPRGTQRSKQRLFEWGQTVLIVCCYDCWKDDRINPTSMTGGATKKLNGNKLLYMKHKEPSELSFKTKAAIRSLMLVPKNVKSFFQTLPGAP